MRLSRHGGSCCGATHIHEFPPAANEFSIDRLKALIKQCRGRNKYAAVALEVILTDKQIVAWEATLLSLNFKLVADWRNVNTGNRLFMYLLTTQTAMNRPIVSARRAA